MFTGAITGHQMNRISKLFRGINNINGEVVISSVGLNSQTKDSSLWDKSTNALEIKISTLRVQQLDASL